MEQVYIKDNNGNRVLPITHTDSVRDSNGTTLTTLLSQKTDTKNTAGSTDTDSKLYIIGATSLAANPLTYSQDTAYVGTDGCLYSGGNKVLTEEQYTGTVNKVKVGTDEYNPTSGVVSLPAYPTTLPASDVSAWAKAADKPSYSANEIGFGYGVCSTASGTAAKTVSVTDFTLTTNGIVSVRFQEGIGVNSSTLNVNGTGAKPIMLGGVALPAGTIGVNTTVVLQYDGTNWNIVGSPNKVEYEYVDLDLPSGNLWATMNVGATSVTDAGLYFQWGDIQGYTAEQVGSGDGQKYFSWSDYKYSDNGGSTAADMTKYNSTDEKTILDTSDDAAITNMGGLWHMPTETDFSEILDTANCTRAWTTDYNGSGINGCLFTSTKNGNTLFFPAVGSCADGQRSDIGSVGRFWSTDINSSIIQGKYLGVVGNSVSILIGYRRTGLSIRGITNKKHINYRDVNYETTSTTDNSLTAGAIQLNGSIPLQTISITGAVTSVSFASGKLPPIGHSCHVIFTSNTDRTIALAHVTTGAVRYICPGGTNPDDIEIPAGGYAEIDFLRVADTIENNSTVSWIYVRGI